MQIYDKIREDNVKKYGTEASRTMKIIVNQYSDRTHFIYEILQNAEDAKASEIRFELQKNHLIIVHNGRLFNEKDIVGVCGIADGTKEDGTCIGHFGIGFKSVYGYSETPRIYSGKYSFEIRNQIFPYEVAGINWIKDNETCIILPFNKEGVTEEEAFEEIKDALNFKVTGESVLLLDSLCDITFSIEGQREELVISKVKGPADKGDFRENVFDINVLSMRKNLFTGSSKESEADYLLFTDANGKESTSIIFKKDKEKIVPIKNSMIYAFFPTAKEAHQGFIIHAPFDTTPARDNFKEGANYGKHNIELLRNVCELIRFAFIWMRDNKWLSFDSFSKVYPIYKYEEKDVLYSIYQNSIDFINSGEQILPTNKEGYFQSISNICVAGNMNIVSVFSDEDLQRLTRTHGNNKRYWLSKEISTVAYASFKAFLDENFSFDTLEWRDLVLKIDEDFLKTKNLEWNERLMGNIENACTRRKDNTHFINVADIPFVRTAAGDQICARNSEGKLQVYLNNPGHCSNRIDIDFLRNETIKSFYERALGIPAYNTEQEVRERIIPKYLNKPIAFVTDKPIRENIEDLKEIKDAIQMNPNIIEAIENCYLVTDGKEWYRPSELYVPSTDERYGYSLVRGILNFKYLGTCYFDDTVLGIRLDEVFFRKIGCNTGIRVLSVSQTDYLAAVKKYVDWQTADLLKYDIFNRQYISPRFAWNFVYEGFPQVLEDISFERSKKIASFLNKNINSSNFDIKGNLVAADDQHYSGANVHSMVAYSMLGLYLCFIPWMYIDGDEKAYRPIDIDRADIRKEYGQYRRLLELLPFKEVKNTMTDWINETIGNASERDLVKRMLSDPESLVRVAKAMAQNDAKQAAKDGKRKGIEERIKEGDKSQKQPESIQAPFEEDDDTVTPISQDAKENREKALEKELKESLDNFTKVTNGLSFTSRICSKEEKAFLEQEYNGRCQICSEKITKHDGHCYFEAINIIKQHELLEALQNSFYLGWNSLCLCPNCAARYNYSSKKISTLYNQVLSREIEADSEEPILIEIELPEGEEKSIKYSPRHFMAIQQAFKIYSER